MLPAWATVAIALGSAAIGALSGFGAAYLSHQGVRLNIDHETREAWRGRQFTAAEEFSQAVNKLVWAFRAKLIPEPPPGTLDTGQFDDAFAAVRLANAPLLFTFGPHSSTAEAADQATQLISYALNAVQGADASNEVEWAAAIGIAQATLTGVDQTLSGFFEAAHGELEPEV